MSEYDEIGANENICMRRTLPFSRVLTHTTELCAFFLSSSSRPPVDDKAIGENRHDNIEMRSDVRSYEKRSY